MLRLLWVSITLFVLAVGAPAGENDNGRPEYRIEKDVSYVQEGKPATPYQLERCRLDLYHPQDRTGFATVVWFHGGGLTGGERHFPAGLQNQGLAIVAANYRLSPKATCPAYIEDAAAAVAWTFRNIGRHGGDPNRIFISGHSAGGYLTSMVGLDKRWLAACGIDADRIAGLIPLSGQTITHSTIRQERGLPERIPLIDSFAPLNHIRPDAPPILLMTGDREMEMVGRYEENAYLMRMLKIVGHKDVTLYEFQGYGHDMVEPAMGPMLRWIREKAGPPGTTAGESKSAREVITAEWFRLPPVKGLSPGGVLIPLLKIDGAWYTTTHGVEIPLRETPNGLRWALTPSSLSETVIAYFGPSRPCSIRIVDRARESPNEAYSPDDAEFIPMTRIEKPSGLLDAAAPPPQTLDDFLGLYGLAWCPWSRVEVRKDGERYWTVEQSLESRNPLRWKTRGEPAEITPLPDRLGFTDAAGASRNLTYNEALKRFELVRADNGIRVPLARIAPGEDAPVPTLPVGVPAWH